MRRRLMQVKMSSIRASRIAQCLCWFPLICVKKRSPVLPTIALIACPTAGGPLTQEIRAMTAASAGRKSATRHKGTPHATRARKRPSVAAGSKHGKTEDPRNEFSHEEWRDMVATAAYYRAEARGFDDGSADEDWYEAEAELRERFSADDSNVETVSTSGGDTTNIETTGE
jgi:hypothetical protein